MVRRVAYADPPYIGRASYYPEKTEVDHAELIGRLVDEFPDEWGQSGAFFRGFGWPGKNEKENRT